MTSTYFTQARRVLILVGILAALAIPTVAFAGTGVTTTPDAFERYASAHPYGQSATLDGRSADTLDAAVNVQQSTTVPDVLERYANTHPYGTSAAQVIDGRSADTLDAAVNAQQSTTVPDVLERYANTHPYGTGAVQVIDGRSADTLDAATNAQQASLVPSDGRSPDTLDAASSPRPVVIAQPGGFDWSDAGIGAGFAGGVFALLLTLGLLMLRRHPRQPIQTT
jgi:hypothetical protein